MKRVFGSYEDARKYEAGQKRTYRVTDGEREVFVVALSPKHAYGEASPEFGLRAELVDRRLPTKGEVQSLDAFVASLSDEQRSALREHLERRLSTAG